MTGTARQMMQRLARPGIALAVLLVVIAGIAGVLEPGFLVLGNLLNIAGQSVFVAIAAVGMTVVLINGGIDLSVGATAAFCAGVTAWLIGLGFPLIAAIVMALMVGALIGLANGLAIMKLGIPAFIATLAMLGILRGLLFVWTDGVPFIGYVDSTYRTIGGLTPLIGRVTVPLLMMAAVAIAVSLLLRRAKLGRHIRAVGSDAHAASLSGVSVDRVRITVYVLSAVVAAIAGVLLAGRLTTVQPLMARGMELNAIAAAVMGGATLKGGRGTVLGAVLGAVVLAVIQNLMNLFGVDPSWELIFTGAILLVAVLANRSLEHVSNRTAIPMTKEGEPVPVG